MKLIPLDAVLVEIEKRIRACGNCYILDELTSLHHTFDSLEVKEVDFKEEIECSLPKPAWGWNEDYFGKSDPAYSIEQMKEFAKHFFELGLKAQEGE